MKFFNKIWCISLLTFLLIAIAPRKSMAQNISEQDFYDNLAPYGTWVNDPRYGDVWVPDAEDGFMPYGTSGHWVLTDYGNTWVSDYPWGWATFHYGRWHYDDYYGWEWIPGYEWAPAWVSWRQGGGYYGWAPLMPGISMSSAFGGGYNIPDNYWVCAPQAYINSSNIYSYRVPHGRAINIIRNTTVINNTYVRGNQRYIAGPGATDIQRVTHRQPQIYRINSANSPGAVYVQNNAVNIFRPAVRKTQDARPARVVDGAAYRQQNPNQNIALRGPGGAPAFNHANAAKLATVARSNTPDNNVVRINNRPNAPQPNPASAQPENRPANGQYNNQQRHDNQSNAPQVNPAPGQLNGRQNYGRPENRPNVTPANPANQPNAPQVNPAPGQSVNGQPYNGRQNRQNVTPANPANQPNMQQAQQQQAQQQQDVFRQQQRAQRQQQRQLQQQQMQQQQRQQQQVEQQQPQQQDVFRQQQRAQRQQQQQMQQPQQQQMQQQQRQQQPQQQQMQQPQQQQQQPQQQQRQQQPQQQQMQQQQRQQQMQQQRIMQQQPRPARQASPPPTEQKPQ
ncbi:MAG: hypothetical protein JWR67_440 [Mucilaginibacter sp.]|nr:hypothetical protein [Mucilaginibacter sp.]